MAETWYDAQNGEIDQATLYNLFLYLGFDRVQENGNYTLSDALADYADGKTSKQLANKEEYQILKQAIEANPELGETRIVTTSKVEGNYDSGTSAAVFETTDGKTYVCYRGTADGEWGDNANGMTQTDTIQQEKAAAFFDDMAEKYGWDADDTIIVTGHSKGGNKAQYVTINAENRDLIDTCYSLDGQGFSPEAVNSFQEKYGADYENSIDKIYAVNGEQDFVNPLGITVIRDDHTVYVEMETGDIIEYHDLVGFYRKADGTVSGAKNSYTEDQGIIGKAVKRISNSVMSLPQEARAAVSMTIMQIVETVTGGTSVGINGEHVTWQQLLGVSAALSIATGVTVANILTGRTGIQILSLIARVGFASVVSVVTEKVKEGWHSFCDSVRTFVSEKGLEKAVLNFLNSVDQTVSDFFGSVSEWWKKHTSSVSVTCRDLKYDEGGVSEIAALLQQQSGMLTAVAQRVREIKNQIDFGLLTKYAFSLQFAECARKVDNCADHVSNLSDALEEIGQLYCDNERRIVNRYQAAGI